MPQTAVAFDIYGTLADTGGVARALQAHTEDAAAFASRWRDKQLEYTFRRTVMGVYADFAQCTKEALLYVCAERGISLGENQRASLTAEYARLPLFADALQALNDLRANDNLRLFAFSNGKAAAVREWLSSRGVLECFVDVVSADEIKQFKPSPEVYNHFLARANATADSAWLVSGNPFDIIGAQNTGMRGAWIKRNNAVFDLWEGVEPTITISSLTELAEVLRGKREAVHVLDAENLCKQRDDGLWETGYWLISEANAKRLRDNGGVVYVHHRQEGTSHVYPSSTGGEIVDFYRTLYGDKKRPKRKSTVLIFQPLAECGNVPLPKGGFNAAGIAYR